MNSRSILRLARLFPLVLLAVRSAAEEAPPAFVAKLRPIPPCPALVAAARTDQIPLDQIDPPTPASGLNPGDSVTGLITLFEKGNRRTQWLVYLEAVLPNAKEQSHKASTPMVLYSSCGTRLEFASRPAFVTLRTLGPFAASETKGGPPKLRDKRARFSLDQGFLSLGLEHAATAICRLRDTKTHGAFSIYDKPPDAAQLSEGRKLAAAVHLTDAEERALGGSVPALLSYFQVVQQTPGLDDILFKLLDLPSFWSLVRHGGIRANVRFQTEHLGPATPAGWGLPSEASVYHFPIRLELNERPALDVTLVVTSPDPPLLACGGIIGLLAEQPGKEENYLTLRIINARQARKTTAPQLRHTRKATKKHASAVATQLGTPV